MIGYIPELNRSGGGAKVRRVVAVSGSEAANASVLLHQHGVLPYVEGPGEERAVPSCHETAARTQVSQSV